MSNSCGSSFNGISTFKPSSSSSFKNLSTPFSITYGSTRSHWIRRPGCRRDGGFLGRESRIRYVIISSPTALGGLLTFRSVCDYSCGGSGVVGPPHPAGVCTARFGMAGGLGLGVDAVLTLASSGVIDSALFAIQLRRWALALKWDSSAITDTDWYNNIDIRMPRSHLNWNLEESSPSVCL